MDNKESDKIIKCYCNDKHACDGNDWCFTPTVCMTRKLQFYNKSTKQFDYRLDYGCGEFENSFRKDIIRFRDCLVKTNITRDYDVVMKSPEHCCNDRDMCNRELNPTEYASDLTQHNNDLTNENILRDLSPALNAILVPIAVVLVLFLIIALIGLIYVLRRNRKLKDKFKGNSERSSKSEIYPFIEFEEIDVFDSYKLIS